MSGVDKDGNVTLTGTANVGALVYAYNDRTGGGAIATADAGGNWKAKLAAQLGDQLEIWQEVGADKSSTVFVTVKK